MPIIQISKIQLRRGPASDLPNPTLDDGELGYTTDTGRLFVGQLTPTNGQPNYDRVAFPYQNVEVLTENSPLEKILAPVFSDNQQCFIQAVPCIVTNTYTTLQVLNPSAVAQNFYLDLPLSGVNARIAYFMFDSNDNAIRQGIITVIWNLIMVGSPVINDTAEVSTGSTSTFTWAATVIGTIGNQHVVLQYINQTSTAIQVYFRIDRPFVS